LGSSPFSDIDPGLVYVRVKYYIGLDSSMYAFTEVVNATTINSELPTWQFEVGDEQQKLF
jgi:hypothetical protein